MGFSSEKLAAFPPDPEQERNTLSHHQHSTHRWNPGQGAQARKGTEGHPDCRGGSETVLFADHMICYIENPKDSIKKR